MKTRALLLVVLVGLLGFVTTAPAAAKKPATGSFTVTIPVNETVTVDGTTITITGTLTADVTHLSVQDGHVVAVATLGGQLTFTSDLGTATVDLTGTRVVLNADVRADCQGNLDITFHGVLQLNATVTFDGTSFTINKTIPLNGSLHFTATTQQQTSLICDISHLLQSHASVNAIVDKLNTLLKTL